MKTMRGLSWAALASLCLWIAACAPSMPIVQDSSTVHTATFISDKVRGVPGTVEWSPQGKYLAYMTDRGDQVMLYDPVSGERRPLEVKDPFFLSWADSLTLLILHGERENPFLTILDISSKKFIKYPLPLGTVAIFGEPGAHYAWAYTESHEWRTIGVDAEYSLFRPDWKKNAIGEVAKIKRLISIRPEGMPFIRGWAKVAPDPVTGRAILLQFITPPRAQLYLKVLAVDTVTLEETEVTRIRTDWVTTQASWSPDGTRLALAGNDGRLKVLSMDGKLTTLDMEVVGSFPAWDPRGGRIFFGGKFIADDGSEHADFVRGSAKATSAAFFSPGGDRMALSLKGNLWLIKGIAPAPGAFMTQPSELYEKTAKLRELFRDGLITKEDYRSRLDLLIQGLHDK